MALVVPESITTETAATTPHERLRRATHFRETAHLLAMLAAVIAAALLRLSATMGGLDTAAAMSAGIAAALIIAARLREGSAAHGSPDSSVP